MEAAFDTSLSKDRPRISQGARKGYLPQYSEERHPQQLCATTSDGVKKFSYSEVDTHDAPLCADRCDRGVSGGGGDDDSGVGHVVVPVGDETDIGEVDG